MSYRAAMDKKRNPPTPVKDKNIAKKPKFCPGEKTDMHDSSSMDKGNVPVTPGPSPDASNSKGAPAVAAAPAWFTDYMSSFETRMQTIISSQLAELSNKVSEQEEKLTACSIQITDLEKEVQRLKVDNNDLSQKLDDLENRSRRNNLVFYGIPEKADLPTLSIMNEVFDFVGIQQKDLGIERCHRTPSHTTSSRQELENKPRMIHICFASFQMKEVVRQECVKKFRSTNFNGKKLFVSDDYSKKVLQQRKNKKDEFQRLKNEGKKPFYIFPARLAFKDGAGKLHIVA